MSKILVDEYKKLAESDIPDLWDRIEAGITASLDMPEKKVAATGNNKDFEVEKVKTVKLSPISYQNRSRFVRRYGGLIAASICAAIIVPVLFFGRQASVNFSVNNESTESTLPAPAAAPMADVFEITEETAFNMISEETALAEADQLWVNDDNSLGSTLTRQSSPEETGSKIEIRQVTVEITAFSVENADLGIANLYSATVIVDETNALAPGTDIYLKISEDLEADIAVLETYLVDLAFEEAAAYYTVVKVW
ncbi:MAG: hypothetical protein FWG91_06310 [Lachnospiraceae bacterium]|nr:hypothetical protein [Lachnospiraceae bacterium]